MNFFVLYKICQNYMEKDTIELYQNMILLKLYLEYI